MKEVFSGLFGNEATKARIGAVVKNDRIPHAFLIDGEDGTGKLTLALEISAAINCENAGDPSHSMPCRTCGSCRRIFGGSHVDIHILEKADGKATIGVDEVKALRSDMFLSSAEARHRVYIIRDAEKMTPEAQNALLIVLEEPPRGVVIMLLAAGADRILTTIKSRAQYIAMARHSVEDIEEFLISKKGATPETARAAAENADGKIGLALSLLDEDERALLDEERSEAMAIIRAMRRSSPYTELYSALSELPTKRAELTVSLERLLTAVADLIRLKHDRKAPLSFFRDRAEAEEIADGIATARLFAIYDCINSAHDGNLKNANTTALITSLGSGIKMA